MIKHFRSKQILGNPFTKSQSRQMHLSNLLLNGQSDPVSKEFQDFQKSMSQEVETMKHLINNNE